MTSLKIELLEFDSTFLEYSWYWMQDEEIRKMIAAKPITKEEQLVWFNGIKSRTDYLIWGISADKLPVGVTGLKNITVTDAEYWGYLGNKEFWGKGIGTRIMELLEELAKKKNLKSIWLKVNKDNIRAVSLYKKMHYKIEKIGDVTLIMRKFL